MVSGRESSWPAWCIISPYITKRSGFFKGLCNPLLGHASALRRNGSSSSTLVFGTKMNGSPFIGSGIVKYSSVSLHSPPSRLHILQGFEPLIASGSSVAYDGIVAMVRLPTAFLAFLNVRTSIFRGFLDT